jgi:hypothetical protein
MIDLSAYKSIQSNLFVRIQIDEYSTTEGGPYSSQVLRFSDLTFPYTLNSESYSGLGKLMDITQSSSELRANGQEMTITIVGIPTSSISEIVNSKIKGAPVSIYRGLFNAETGQFLSVSGNPLGRFQGFVNNYTLTEEFDSEARTSSTTISLTCTSVVNVLENKVAGRKTNPKSQKQFYPTDVSMDRVPTLKGATYNFGAP